jgi:DNA-binding NarL/FixJ family response regulator
VRVIVLTNFATAQHRQASRAAGADAFLDKSQDFALVPQLLREWIDSAASAASPELRPEQKH